MKKEKNLKGILSNFILNSNQIKDFIFEKKLKYFFLSLKYFLKNKKIRFFQISTPKMDNKGKFFSKFYDWKRNDIQKMLIIKKFSKKRILEKKKKKKK